MDRKAKTWIGGAVLLVVLTACATVGEYYEITLSYQPGPSPPSLPALPSKIVVFPFEDARPNPNSVGQRVHLFGRVDTFDTKIPVGERIAQLLVESLRQKGWDARLGERDARHEAITGDRFITGKVQTLWAEAVSHLGYTQLDINVDFDLKIVNPATGERDTFRVKNQNYPRVVLFYSDDIEKNLNEMVSSGLNHFHIGGGS